MKVIAGFSDVGNDRCHGAAKALGRSADAGEVGFDFE